MKKYATVGKREVNVDGFKKVLGTAKYIEDIYLPNMLHGKLFRSKLPHAKILKIDIEKAKRLPGVKAVVTADDAPKKRFYWLLSDQTVFAQEKVRYIGQPVAAVAATDLNIAEEAISLIEVEYEELPAVFSAKEAMQPGAPIIHEELKSYKTMVDGVIRYENVCTHIKIEQGDIEDGFKQADHIFENEFETQAAYVGYLEPHGVLANYEPDGKITVWANTQTPFATRWELADIFEIPMSKIRVIAPCIGGGFGGKTYMYLEPYGVLLSKISGKPVRIILDREEDIIDGRYRHPCNMKVKTGVKKDGAITARQFNLIYDAGAFACEGPGITRYGAVYCPGPYRTPNLKVDSYCVYTNKVPFSAYRGYGVPQSVFAGESQLDIIAKELGIDPLELRLKNAVKEGDLQPVLEHKMEGVAYMDTLNLVRKASNWGEKLAKNQGRGLASMIYTCGGFSSSATVKVNEDGSVILLTGATDIGQGSNTVLSQIVAEELGIELKNVFIVSADTETTPFDVGTFGDTCTHDAGNAVRLAAKDAKNQLLEHVSEMLEANVEDLIVEDGRIYVKGSPDKAKSIAEISLERHYFEGGPVVGRGTFLEKAPPQFRLVQGNTFPPSFSPSTFASQVAEVEVDPRTGKVSILNFYGAHDCGQPINIMNVEGQIEGAAAQGIGYALTEEIYFDKGKILNSDLLNYKMPTSVDIPNIVPMVPENYYPGGPFGAKGVGEPGLIPAAPAIANAIFDAVGVRITSLPITPEKILKALKAKNKEEG